MGVKEERGRVIISERKEGHPESYLWRMTHICGVGDELTQVRKNVTSTETVDLESVRPVSEGMGGTYGNNITINMT